MQNRISCATAFLAVAVFSSWAVLTVTSTTDTYFTGAVFEFVQTQHCTSDPEEAMEVIQFNLDIFVPVAVLAKSKGADIIVFPEYSIFPECSRDQTALFCEVVPDPKKVKANPCVEAEEFADRTTLRTLSCMARNNSIVVQANMGDMQKCEGEPGCPPEGHWQYNTNVVFDKDGTIIARYRKEHLWQEYHFDLPQEKQDPKFTVDFGTYLSYVCFDIFLERIIEEELDDDVDGVIFSTMWENTMPMGMTVEFFQAWVMATNLTLLAACIQLPGQMALGSGLFHGQYGALAYTYDPDGLSKLVVARVPRNGHPLLEPQSSITAVAFNGSTYDWESDGDNVQCEGSETILPLAPNQYYDDRYHVINFENYTIHKITEPSGSLQECNNGVCCSMDYSADDLSQTYYFAVFNGTQETFYPYYWGEENCILVRCDAAHGRECATFPLCSDDVFHHVNITANFSSPFIYPAVIHNRMRLTPRSDWDYNTELEKDGYRANVNFHSDEGRQLVVVGLKARTYRLDPASSFF